MAEIGALDVAQIVAAATTVKAASGDTTPSTLTGKLAAGTNVTLTTLNPTGDAQIQINAASTVIPDPLTRTKIILTGVDGVGLDAGSQRIIGVPSVPTATTDAVNQAYVDGVAQGLTLKIPAMAVRVGANLAISGTGQVIDSAYTVVAGARVLLTAQTTAAQNGIWVAVAGTATPTGSVTCVAVADLVDNDYFTINDGTNAAVVFEYKVTGGFTPTGGRTTIDVSAVSTAAEVATATYTAINAVGNALWVTATSPTTEVVTLTHDVSGTSGNVNITEDVANAGFSVSGMSGGTGGTWTRPVDFAAAAHVAGAFCFVEKGTLYAESGWVCTNDAPTDVVGTDSLAYVQFSAAGVTLAGTGLTKSGNTISMVTLDPSPAGSYTNLAATVDATGRVTAAASGAVANSVSINCDETMIAGTVVYRTATGVAAARADTAPHSTAVIGVLAVGTNSGNSGPVVCAGPTVVKFASDPSVGVMAYLSTATAGQAQTATPAVSGTNQKLRLGYIASAQGGGSGLATVILGIEKLPITADGNP